MIGIFYPEKEKLALIPNTTHGYLGGMIYYDAANNTDSKSRGPLPPGIYEVLDLIHVKGAKGKPDGKLGPVFIVFKDFKQRIQGQWVTRKETGIHSGRKNKSDGLARKGYRYCTYGCIRTEDQCTAFIESKWETDPLTHVWVVE